MNSHPILLFPSDHFKTNKPDEMFTLQAEALHTARFECIYVNVDELSVMTKLPVYLFGKEVIYCG